MPAFDVFVRGSGPVGKSLALALAQQGLSVACSVAPARARPDDFRAFALNAPAVELLQSLRVWSGLPAEATVPVHEMQVRGDSPQGSLEFTAWQQRVGELAVIVDAAALDRQLDAALAYAPRVVRSESEVEATLVAHCEGAAAAVAAGVDSGFTRSAYAQTAIAARLVASLPHRHVAWQWFGAPDVLALLPFDRPEPGRSYALVWSLPNERAAELTAVDAAEFEAALGSATGGAAGTLRLASERVSWPLAVGHAERWCGAGWVVLGDAAHVVHPLAGQGLNLGLADVAALAGVIAAREPWRSVGDERLLRRYVRRRAAPTWAMLRITDGLQRLFEAPSAPLRELRNNGMRLVDRLPPLKRWLATRALDS